MNLTINLPDDNVAELEARARLACRPNRKLEKDLDDMAPQVVRETTAEDTEAAKQEALDHLRPRRTLQLS